jgi:hypothetical protein
LALIVPEEKDFAFLIGPPNVPPYWFC